MRISDWSSDVCSSDLTFSALTTITWSPMSRWGAYTGLCFPRRMRAASVESRPRTRSSASITNHLRVISLALGLYVRTRTTLGVAGGTSRGALAPEADCKTTACPGHPATLQPRRLWTRADRVQWCQSRWPGGHGGGDEMLVMAVGEIGRAHVGTPVNNAQLE